MNFLEKYITLFLHFQRIIDKSIQASIEEISQILFCTPRNSRIIIKKFVDLGWIQWEHGMGRGNKSKIIFKESPYDLIIKRAMELVRNGELRSARKLINEYENIFHGLTHEFNSWIETLFGYKIENYNQKEIDVLRIKANIKPIVNLDPICVFLRSQIHILKQVNDTLVNYNYITGQIEPHIAFFWEYNSEKNSWTIYLRKGILFHNGKILTSKDVAYTFNRFSRLTNNKYKWMLEDLKEVSIIDKHTLVFYLKNKNELFLQILSNEHLSILPCPDANNQEQEIHEILIGTGPFKMIKNDENIIILKANETYFKGRPFLDRVEIWNIKAMDDKTEKSNEISLAVNTNQIAEVNYINGFEIKSNLEWNVQYLTINLCKDNPLQDIFFRKALKNILNPLKIIDDLGGDRCEAAEGFISFGNEGIEILNYEKIKYLLKQSSYDGETINLYTFEDQDHIDDTNWIIKQCKEYGIIINATFFKAEELMDIKRIKEADIIHDSASLSENIEISYLDLLLSDDSFIKNHLDIELSNSSNNIIKQFYEIEDVNKRMELLRIIEKNIINHYNVIPLYRNRSNVHSHDMIQNLIINKSGWIDFYHIWFKNSNI